jgi:hypothetical protein
MPPTEEVAVEALPAWPCPEPSCAYVETSRAGLVAHLHEVHFYSRAEVIGRWPLGEVRAVFGGRP